MISDCIRHPLFLPKSVLLTSLEHSEKDPKPKTFLDGVFIERNVLYKSLGSKILSLFLGKASSLLYMCSYRAGEYGKVKETYLDIFIQVIMVLPGNSSILLSYRQWNIYETTCFMNKLKIFIWFHYWWWGNYQKWKNRKCEHFSHSLIVSHFI